MKQGRVLILQKQNVEVQNFNQFEKTLRKQTVKIIRKHNNRICGCDNIHDSIQSHD